MKRRALQLLALLLILSAQTFAQLPAASLAPNFTFKDLNGNSHTLYDYLAQGKTVFIDVSTAWCGPCWDYHITHEFANLYKAHGPSGMSGVNSNTTDDVMVLFIEAEGTNTKAQLYGTSGTGLLHSMGDWVTGTPYPIIDTNASVTNIFKSAWRISSFPTIYMVCRDRLAYSVGRKTAAELYALSQQSCPAYAPTSTIDAKALSYTGNHYFFCNGTPTVRFQNYSTTSPLTNATIKVYDGAHNLATTYNWTGNVAPMAIGTATIPAFSPTQLQGYHFEVNVPGDLQTANNTSDDSLFKVYSNAGQPLPYAENFEGPVSPLLTFPKTAGMINISPGTLNDVMIDKTGARGKGVVFNFWVQGIGQVHELIVGNINTATVSNNATFNFDLAYCQNNNELDSLEVYISNNCGSNWTRAWGKAGPALATRQPYNRMYTPFAASHWRQESFSLRNFKGTNMLVKFRGTGMLGNNPWIDNLKITDVPVSVTATPSLSELKIWPNPAGETITASFYVQQAGNINIAITDITGRTVYNQSEKIVAGAHEFSIPTSNIPAGLYVIGLHLDNRERLQQKLYIVK
jgi:thiol-disulfide isomerase/thioredoxin